jgi:hypothetical protein
MTPEISRRPQLLFVARVGNWRKVAYALGKERRWVVIREEKWLRFKPILERLFGEPFDA